ncbi:Glycosyltransferase, catalytic subunit of cellulose synthase and poly-beta-1,6-N-acetylglucosamine synthase [Saccharicrinis carchari]|uniref:Glycosyltransferase, catalytic subunit of cellulose synthase and poly-beta-1,6-N-acetylglucosamine synthase n=1 Tax=Saccharicrinis carchari TaxID=1168039 RepID=A0A521DQH3_SACCC|nr:glycosyltransferase [Saccharicrinis carchari]SMO73361.1 Glycosyltransferase, catalytic subunit of cellulose synthase and poly-beta-1,6-N-acetylglucosamine synthase [Saccharicrinis carchari]
MPKYSVIIPVYNRPHELDELLHSLTLVNYKDFEVIVVEDGSQRSSKDICAHYKNKLNLRYEYQNNTGPGPARNTGAGLAQGDYFLFFDSDCLIPAEYFNRVDEKLDNVDCFGGPDMAHPSFNTIQKAISYSMTATLTTGGIRGGKKKLDKFYPRSFNMGIKKEVFQELKGFAKLRFGEDLDFSMRILEAGYTTKLIIEAGVYHKRRNNFKSFFKQVYNSGIARINLNYRHPGSLKMVHALPALFTIGYIITILAGIYFPSFYLLALFPWIIFIVDASIQSKSVKVGMASSLAAMVQIVGYGLGFISATIKRKLFRGREFTAYEKNFYD